MWWVELVGEGHYIGTENHQTFQVYPKMGVPNIYLIIAAVLEGGDSLT